MDPTANFLFPFLRNFFMIGSEKSWKILILLAGAPFLWSPCLTVQRIAIVGAMSTYKKPLFNVSGPLEEIVERLYSRVKY